MMESQRLSRPARCLVVFDVDNSLLPPNGPPSRPVLVGMQALRKAGARLALASGKPCIYLSGLVRGMDVMDACLIGENGADIWLTSTMPPQSLPQPLEAGEAEALDRLRTAAVARLGDRIFLQPNRVGVTAFPVDPCLQPEQIADVLRAAAGPSLTAYVHNDSVDWAVSRLNKGRALALLAVHLKVRRERVFAIGDGRNDLCMADVVGQMWWLGPPELLPAGVTPVQTIEDALWCVLEQVRGLD